VRSVIFPATTQNVYRGRRGHIQSDPKREGDTHGTEEKSEESKSVSQAKTSTKKKAVKAKKKAIRRKPTKNLVKKIPVQPRQTVEAEIQQNAEDLEERQDQIHEAEEAIVDEADREEFGKAV
jgi:hypothetical protein